MRIENITNLKVLAKIAKKGVTEQTKEKTYYSLICLQGTESFQPSVPEEVYNFVKEGEINSFATVFSEGFSDGKPYHSFRIVGFAPKNSQSK